jgi:prevent-host-death family protein
MTQISVSELKANAGKYVNMAVSQDIFITKNGKVVAKLVSARPDKVSALNHLLSLFPEGMDVDLDSAKEERLSGK